MEKSFEEYKKENPLLEFSLYTNIQLEILMRVGKEINDLLNKAIDENTISAKEFQKAYDLFWLWVLGAYEVIRTMYQARRRFSSDAKNKLKRLKEKLNRIREPFAKQEYAGKNVPIHGEFSVSKFNTTIRDICFIIKDNNKNEGEDFWARALIEEFNQVTNSINAKDIVTEGD